ncbi:flagellar basal body P-ring formation chaperone FlgA [Roseospira navarrensis]|uniref:Flagellar basal body P-ring formation protein FlgA n=1 Tax=Roseospira navarrensis TaxID=140058 RepID=A0A7X2D3P8_9PROT|nr:flagellar basal body P-ring formation chaperone FlgA [Roseospira navarrensis]MQX35395.1 flagellar basal body P-ring formation protein FlgA [Roseospira navarrensis]
MTTTPRIARLRSAAPARRVGPGLCAVVLALGLGAGTPGVAAANEVVVPQAPQGTTAGAVTGLSSHATGGQTPPPSRWHPDIVALADALSDESTRRAVLDAPPTPARGDAYSLRAALRPEVTIERALIQLGDVFGGLPPEVAAIPIGHAPQPGERLVLGADYLNNLAVEYGVDWSPASRYVQTVVNRRSYTIGRDHIIDALRERLLAEGIPFDAEVDITAHNIRAAVGSPDEMRVAVRDLYYDDRTGRFNAMVQVPAEGPSARLIRLAGSVHQAIDVPVLVRPIRRGMVITEADVRWETLRGGDVGPNTLLEIDDLIGQAARQGIQAGQPVRVNQVRMPELVQRNGLVTMVLETPFMTLTARGRALEAGAKGETVRVANMASGKEILAVVTGQNTVRVAPNMVTVSN